MKKKMLKVLLALILTIQVFAPIAVYGASDEYSETYGYEVKEDELVEAEVEFEIIEGDDINVEAEAGEVEVNEADPATLDRSNQYAVTLEGARFSNDFGAIPDTTRTFPADVQVTLRSIENPSVGLEIHWRASVPGVVFNTQTVSHNQVAFTMPAGDVTITAEVRPVSHRITIRRRASQSLRGVVNANERLSSTVVQSGRTINVRANVPVGYVFDRWESGWWTAGAFGNDRNPNTQYTVPHIHGSREITLTAWVRPRTTDSPARNIARRATTTRATYLRRGPGTRYHRIRRIPQGRSLTVIHNRQRSGWNYVRVGDHTGWIRSNALVNNIRMGRINTNRIPMRSEPGARAGRELRRLDRNTRFTIIATNGSSSDPWIQIRVGGRTGWVRSRYVRTTTERMRGRRTASLRLGPGSRFNRNGRMRRNARVRVVGRQGRWSRIRVGSRTGWVRTTNLRR